MHFVHRRSHAYIHAHTQVYTYIQAGMCTHMHIQSSQPRPGLTAAIERLLNREGQHWGTSAQVISPLIHKQLPSGSQVPGIVPGSGHYQGTIKVDMVARVGFCLRLASPLSLGPVHYPELMS